MNARNNIVCSSNSMQRTSHCCPNGKIDGLYVGLVDGATGVCTKCGEDVKFIVNLWADNYMEPEPVEEFDVEQYEPHDKESFVKFTKACGFLHITSYDEDDGYSNTYLNKDDSIAIAKHFKLTEDDLK